MNILMNKHLTELLSPIQNKCHALGREFRCAPFPPVMATFPSTGVAGNRGADFVRDYQYETTNYKI